MTTEEIEAELRVARALIAGECSYRRNDLHNRMALVTIVEQLREEIALLKQCHYCKHGDHRHAVDTKRCVNTIERRCQCEEPA